MEVIEIKVIPVDDIAIDETQARQGDIWFEDEQDKELLNSITGIGLIHYIVVRPTNSKKYSGKIKKPYILVAGSRRLNVMIRAGVTEVPCKVMDLTDIEAIAVSYSENIGRKNLTEYQKLTTITTWIKLLIKKYTNEEIIKYLKDKRLAENKIVEEIKKNDNLTMIDLAEIIGKNEKSVASFLGNLKNDGIIGSNASRTSEGDKGRPINVYHFIKEREYTKADINKQKRIEAIKEIANICFGGNRIPIYQILKTNKLSENLKLLIKKPEERTKADDFTLKKYDIKPEVKMNISNLTTIENIVKNLGKIPESKKIEKIYKIIKEFTLDKKNSIKQAKVLSAVNIRVVKSKISDENRDKSKDEEIFKMIIKETKLDEQYKNITFTLPLEYIPLHIKALKNTDKKAAQLIRTIYLAWLKGKAKKEGWQIKEVKK